MVVLTIDGKAVTPSGDVNTALTYELDDIEGGTTGSRSERAVNVVADKTVGIIFAPLSDATRVLANVPGRKPARLEADGVHVFAGQAQLLEATAPGTTYGRRDGVLRLALLGNNAAWFPQIAKMRIADIVRPYITGETFTTAFCAANDNADPTTDKWGLFLARTVAPAVPTEVQRLELSFFAFIAPLLREAFRLAGYHIDSDFLDSEEGRRYILPLPARPVGTDFFAEMSIYVGDKNNPTALPSALGGGNPALIILAGDAANTDTGDNYDNTTGLYTVPFSGHYIIQVGGKPFNFYAPFTDALGVIFAGGTLYPGSTHHSERVFLTAGQLIGLFGAGLPGATAGQSYMSITPDFKFGENYTIDLSMFAPSDWLVGDMLQGLAAIFGLVFDTDVQAGRVRIEPRDRFTATLDDGTIESQGGFYSDEQPVDWSSKRDTSKTAEGRLLATKSISRLQYDADGSDETMQSMDTSVDLRFAAAQYLFPADRFDSGEVLKTVPFFKKTAMGRAPEAQHENSQLVPVLPILHRAKYPLYDTEPTDTEPRILYFAGRRLGKDGYMNLMLTPGLSLYDFPAAWFVPYNQAATANEPSLSFANEPSALGILVPGVTRRYHLQRLKRQEVGLLLEEYMLLGAADIHALDFRRRIHITGSTYILRRVEAYRPGASKSTKVLLESDVAPSEADASKINSSKVNGLQ